MGNRPSRPCEPPRPHPIRIANAPPPRPLHRVRPTKSTTPPTSLGDLGKLPREVREGIYAFTFYDTHWHRDNGGWWKPFDQNESQQSPAIMRTSRAIHAEAVDTLYREQLFESDVTTCDRQPRLCRRGWKQAKRVQNVMLEFDFHRWDPISWPGLARAVDDARKAMIATIRPFSGQDVHRNVCIVRISAYSSTVEGVALVWDALAKMKTALKNLTGFRRVIIEEDYWKDRLGQQPTILDFDHFVEWMRPELELVLGPGMKRRTEVHEKTFAKRTWTAIEFRPRAFIVGEAEKERWAKAMAA